MPAAVLGFVLAAAVLSGAASLLYEVVWLRMLGLVVGHAVDALAAVLAAFMAGLAIGAGLFRRLAGGLRLAGGRHRSLRRAPAVRGRRLAAGVAPASRGPRSLVRRLERAADRS